MSLTGTLTGGLLETDQPDYAGMSKKAEQRRQALLNQGMAQINAIFSGGTVPQYSALMTPMDQKTWKEMRAQETLPQYYNIGKQGFSPYKMPGTIVNNNIGSGAAAGAMAGSIVPGLGTAIGAGVGALAGMFLGGKEFPRQEFNKQVRRGNIYTKEDKTFQGFTPEFFQQRQDAYINNAMPQLNQQYQDAYKAMLYGLGNRGLTHSTQAGQQQNRLNLQAGQAKQQIVDQGIGQANQLKQQVEQSRQNAINMLYQTSNPGQATQAAIGSAAGFQQPSTFAPLANMFGNVFNQYYQSQLLNAMKGQGGSGGNSFGGNSFGGNSLFDASAALPKY